MPNGIYPRPRVEYGMTHEDYAAAAGIRASYLQAYARCTAYARFVRDHVQEPKESLTVGIAGHVLMLEPHRFDDQYVQAPKFDRRTKVGKKNSADFVEANAGKTVLTEEQYVLLHRMRFRLWGHAQARELLSGTGANEVSVWVTDADTGLLRKSRDDRHALANGTNILVDLKTTKAAACHGSIEREIVKYQYHSKAAFHLDNARLAIPGRWEFVFVFVEKAAPNLVAVYPLADDALEQGRRDYRRWLRTCATCMETDVWPGYEYDGEDVSIPGWAFDQDDPVTLKVGGKDVEF